MFQSSDPAFNEMVWLIARQVPAGAVTTYGQIASMIPPPLDSDPRAYDQVKARWAGSAMNGCPDGVPWQRVINSQGKISLPKGSRTANRQRELLEAEGVAFDEKGRVDFDQFGWDGPSTEWLDQQGLLPPRSLKSGDAKQLGLFW